MFTLIGVAVVVGSVLGGFMIAGGKIMALVQISEFIVVGGTALGTILISTPLPVIKALARDIPRILKPSPFSGTLYLESLKMLFELFQMAQRDGLVAIESHIESPDKSSLFKKYPMVVAQHHAMTFLCDSLRLVLMGSVPPHDLEMLLDSEIDVHHEQEAKSATVLSKVSDSLPGIGIVAAVLGVVVTMAAISGPVEKVGEHVAAALTGTFLGVLLAYGFVGPLGTALEHVQASETRYYHFIKASVVAVAKGSTPIVSVEFARRAITSEVRPTFVQMEEACKRLKQKPGAAGNQNDQQAA
jgi:chemotaxis protein MotA